MRDSKANVFVAGHQGMVGSAIVRRLQNLGSANVVTRTRSELDLTNQEEVNSFFQHEPIDQLYIAAAKVGGIHANNSYPADFIYQNLAIQTNLIYAAHQNEVQKLLFLGSSCIYPRNARQPMREEDLLTGLLEPTNEPYAIAKIAGIKLCESFNRQYGRDYRSVMPTNLYGPGDNYHGENSHVIPALIKRFHEAKILGQKEVVVWGSGTSRREFLFVDDMAEACVFVMNLSDETWENDVNPRCSHLNIGTGKDCTIRELGESIAITVGFSGELKFDATKPNGAPRKLLDVSKIRKFGWSAKTSLESGLSYAYEDYLRVNI